MIHCLINPTLMEQQDDPQPLSSNQQQSAINYESIFVKFHDEDGSARYIADECMKEAVKQAIKITLQEAASKVSLNDITRNHLINKESILNLEQSIIYKLTK